MKLTSADFADEIKQAERIAARQVASDVMRAVVRGLYPAHGTAPFTEAWGWGESKVRQLARSLGVRSLPGPKPPCSPETVAKLRRLVGMV